MTQSPKELLDALRQLSWLDSKYKKALNDLTGLSETSCAHAGKRAKICSNCFETESEIIPALEHKLDDWVIGSIETCTQPGFRCQKCETCGNIINYEEIPATGHTFTSWSRFVMADDAAFAVEIRFCNTCGYYELRQAEQTDPVEPSTEP